ncbi:MAG TPA: SGNH/GDSL hydrolase family protein [Planctomycetaceae bacterium]|nr:SGNH/GDSL hydrolase family protein [Planctomycetaceae bacterium]
MTRSRCLFVVLALWFPVCSSPARSLAADEPQNVHPIRVLLLGDSTCIGSVCRTVAPHADHLEQVIEKLLATEKDLPPVQVLNKGRDGEYIRGLLTSGRYDREIMPIKDLDFVLVRYGPNDRARLKDFPKEFPHDLRDLLERLRKNHPRASLVLMTMIPLAGKKGDAEVNDIVRSIATEQKLPLCDIHTRYAAELKFGPNMLNYRRVPLKDIPDRVRPLLGDATVLKDGTVVVLDNGLDAHLRDVPNWFRDRHPNLAGYHVIGDETAKFLAPLIRQRSRHNK